MVSALVCSGDGKTREELLGGLRDLAARLTEEEWSFRACRSLAECEALLQEKPLVDLLCCDVTQPELLAWAERFRQAYARAPLLVVADASVPPQSYLRPQILASSLLLRPWQRETLRRTLADFIRYGLNEQAGEDKSLVLKTREGRVLIPYDRVYYLEAREKKLAVRLLREEYTFYGTLEKLEGELPDSFLRCHRSFLVNTRMIEKVRLSDNLIVLRDGFSVPLSRGYRDRIKELGI